MKKIKVFLDNTFWYVIYSLPLLCYLINCIHCSELLSLSQFISNMGINLVTDNIILNCLNNIFGASGILPLFSSNDILIVLSYFVSVYLIHLAIDFLLFIPRLSHNWLNKLWGVGDDKI